MALRPIHVVACWGYLVGGAIGLSAQGINPGEDPSASLRAGAGAAMHILSRQQVLAREKWQMAGRKLRRENPAALRARAIRQKLATRAALSLSSSTPVSG